MRDIVLSLVSSVIAGSVLAKATLPDAPHPIFIVAGQTARSNLAAARLLAKRNRDLLKSYGGDGRFCPVPKIVEPLTFGPDFVEVETDVTADAFGAAVVDKVA